MDRPVSTLADWRLGLRSLELPPNAPVIAHASLSAFGFVEGGADTVLDALLEAAGCLIMPAFTYATMALPDAGPPNNGVTYGRPMFLNYKAHPFAADLPADSLIGVIPETLRRRLGAVRSMHPILSFTGWNAAALLERQTIDDPFAPIDALAEAGGWVLLLGVDHTANTSVHWAEHRAGRAQFIRWALTSQGMVECPGFPGCSDGFEALDLPLARSTRYATLGRGLIRALPLAELLRVVTRALAADPFALLCDRSYCERCNAFRFRYRIQGLTYEQSDQFSNL